MAKSFTVQNLIDRLSQFDPNLEVFVMDDGNIVQMGSELSKNGIIDDCVYVEQLCSVMSPIPFDTVVICH